MTAQGKGVTPATPPPLQTDASQLVLLKQASSLILSPTNESGKRTKTPSSVVFAPKTSPKAGGSPAALTRAAEGDSAVPPSLTTSGAAAGRAAPSLSTTTALPPPAAAQCSPTAEAKQQLNAALASLNLPVSAIADGNRSALIKSASSTLQGAGSAKAAATSKPTSQHSTLRLSAHGPLPAPTSGPPSAANTTRGSKSASGVPPASKPGPCSDPACAPAADSPSTAPAPTSSSRPASRLCTPNIHNLSLGQVGASKPQSSQARKVASSQGTRSGPGLLGRKFSPMADFRPSRAQLLMVFNALDSDKTGKITQSVLEEACISLGFSLQNAHSLYERLDVKKKGYITHLDWGSKEISPTIDTFSSIYLRRFLGLPDASASPLEVQMYQKAQEQKQIKSLPVALNMLRINAVNRGSHSALHCGDVIFDAFAFLDSDSSGFLNKVELRDGFSVLGVNVSDAVADEIMKLFDRDGSGTVEYHEFVKTMFKQ